MKVWLKEGLQIADVGHHQAKDHLVEDHHQDIQEGHQAKDHQEEGRHQVIQAVHQAKAHLLAILNIAVHLPAIQEDHQAKVHQAEDHHPKAAPATYLAEEAILWENETRQVRIIFIIYFEQIKK